MTANDRFDDIVARWLLEAGPADIRPVAVELALERAAQLPQRRGLQSWLVGTPLQPSRTRVALLVALAALALAAAALVAGTLLRPSPLGGGGWINVSSSSTDIHILTADGALDRSFTRGHNSCPRLSPDGSEVAYNIRWIGMNVTRLADEKHRRVGSGAGNNFGYREGVWSPNRAYLSWRAVTANGQALEVTSVFDPAAAKRTLFSTTTDELLTEAAWSADSKLVAIGYGHDSEFRVAVVDLDGVVRATHGPFAIDPVAADLQSLAWSPEGARLVYQAAAGRFGVIDLASGTLSESVAVGFGDFAAASPWSPDGRLLAMVGAYGDLVIARADGTVHVVGPAISVGPIGEIPRWSPVANVVAVMTPTGLVTVAADGGNRTDLRTIPVGVRLAFAWSPDGSRIVVAEDRGESGGLQVANLDATGRSAAVSLGTFPSIGGIGECGVRWDAPTNP